MTGPLDDYLKTFGRSVRGRQGADPGYGRRALRVAVPLAACSAGLAAVLLSGSDAARPVDAVAAARAAVASSSGTIVHLRIATTAAATGSSSRVLQRTEQWTVDAPVRWRMIERTRRGRSSQLRAIEVAFGDGAQSTYTPSTNHLYIREGLSPRGTAARVPGLFGTDPKDTILDLFNSGTAKDLGLVRSAGREVRRLRVTKPQGNGLTDILTYDVDPKTFAPVGGLVRTPLPLRPRGQGAAPEIVRRYTVELYQRIPLTAQTRRLVRITPPRDASIERVTAAEAKRRIARQAARCRKLPDGTRACRLPEP